jgi:hypothetical protein
LIFYNSLVIIIKLGGIIRGELKEGNMTIDTRNLVSESEFLTKELKKNSRVEERDNVNLSVRERILNDFAEIKHTDTDLRMRLISNNRALAIYEEDLTRTQFVQDRLKEIRRSLGNNDFQKAQDIVENAKFNNEEVLAQYFESKIDLESLTNAEELLESELKSLDREFNKIAIAEQNILSFVNNESDNSLDIIGNIDMTDILSSLKLDSKKILDLIS